MKEICYFEVEVAEHHARREPMIENKPMTLDEAMHKGYHFNQAGTHEKYICMKREQFREILEAVRKHAWEGGVVEGYHTGMETHE